MGRLGLTVLTFTLMLPLSGPVLAQGISLEEAFERTAQLHSKPYAVGRDFLLSRGDEIAELVEVKLSSPDWRERRLASVLAPVVESVPDGKDPAVALVDRLWEDFRGVHGHDRALWARALPVLGEQGDIETARAVLHMCEKGALRHFDGAIAGTLVAIGKPALPAIREAMGYPHWAPVPAAIALGRIGGDENRELLEESLPNVIGGRHAEAICSALAKIGDPRSLPVLLDGLIRSAGERRSSGSWEHVDYGKVRSAVLSYGVNAKPFLARAAAKDAAIPGRFFAGGILDEIENPDGGPQTIPRIAERAARGDLGALEDLALSEEKGLAFDVTADVIDRRVAYVNPTHERLLARLGELDGKRAVAYYAALPDAHRLHYSPNAVIRGILFADHPSGLPLIEEIERVAGEKADGFLPGTREPFVETAALAAAVREVLTGGTHRLFDLLRHPEISVREAAALRILSAGDLRAIPALVKVAAERRGRRNRFLVGKLIAHGLLSESKGRSAIPLYGRLAEGAEVPLVRLQAEEVYTRLKFASLAAAHDEAMSPPPWRMHVPPKLDYYQRVGHAIGGSVGPAGVSLLESVVAFHGGRRELLFATFALSKLGMKRSIPILLAAARERRTGGAELGAALREFGPAGIEAAKEVPTADPGRRGFRGRRGRHAGATEALVAEDDPEGVEKILAGLTVTPPEGRVEKRTWENVCQRYLRLAGRYDDPRLLHAALAFLGRYGDGYLYAALPVLARHADDRVEPYLIRTLGFEKERQRKEGFRALQKRFGDGTVEKLLDLLRTSKNGAVRCGAAWGLGDLASAGRKEEEVAPIREKVIEPLLSALKSGNGHLRQSAAEALARVIWNKFNRKAVADRRPLGPLTDWLGGRTRDYWKVLAVFTESRDTEGTELLLEAYGKMKAPTAWMADALATLGRTEVIPDLVRWKRYHSLAALGEPGLAELHRFFREGESMYVRARSLDLLREKSRRIPFAEVEERFRKLSANACWDPLLSRPADKRMGEMSYGMSALARGLAWLDRETAYPMVKLAMLETRHDSVRRGLELVLTGMEKAQPALKTVQPTAEVASWSVEPAEIRFLELCDRFREAVAFGRGQANQPFPEKLVAKLATEGMDALETAVELCYPQLDSPSAGEIAADVRGLGTPATRDTAVHRLALGIYENRHLDAALAACKGEALRYGLAVRRWRMRNDPWFVMHRRRLLGIATNLAASRLPVATVREYALTNLDRLAEIDRRLETFLYYEPLAPVLASIRMSDDPRERARLGEFLKSADPAACLTGYYVTVRTVNEASGVWRELPDHDYSAEVLGAAAMKVATYLTSSIHYERDALKFAFINTPRWHGFDVLNVLRDEHPDEAVRKAADALRPRRR